MGRQVDLIMDYEGGDITKENFMELFSILIKNGNAWTLQGHYGRTAHGLIQMGYISKDGDILKYPNGDGQ